MVVTEHITKFSDKAISQKVRLLGCICKNIVNFFISLGGPKDLSKPRRDIHLVEIKYCEDTRPQNQLNAAKEQHKDLCNILQGASVTLHIILLGLGDTIYNIHTLKPFKELGLDSQRVKKLASKLYVLNLSILDAPFSIMLSTLISSQFQAKPATLLIPIDFPFLFAVEELYSTRYQSGSFSLIMWGVACAACVVFSSLFFSWGVLCKHLHSCVAIATRRKSYNALVLLCHASLITICLVRQLVLKIFSNKQ